MPSGKKTPTKKQKKRQEKEKGDTAWLMMRQSWRKANMVTMTQRLLKPTFQPSSSSSESEAEVQLKKERIEGERIDALRAIEVRQQRDRDILEEAFPSDLEPTIAQKMKRDHRQTVNNRRAQLAEDNKKLPNYWLRGIETTSSSDSED